MNENTATLDQKIDAQQQVKLFSIDEALDSKGFALYLGRHPEFESVQIDDSNAQQIEQLYTTFQSLERIRPEVIKNLSAGILKDTTIKLEADDQEKIAASLEQMAIDDPQSIQRWAERIQTKISVEEAQQQLVATQRESRELRPYSGEETELFIQESISKAARLEKALRVALNKKLDLPLLRRFILPDDVKAGQQEAMTLFGKDWRKKLNEMQQHIDKTRALVAETKSKSERAESLAEQVKQKSREYWSMRRDLDNLVDMSTGLRETLIIRVQEKIDHMLDAATTVKELESATGMLETFEKGPDISTLNTLSETDIDRVKNFIDKKFEAMASTMITEKIAAYEIPGNRALSMLESQLNEILATKAVGGRSEEDSRDFICETIETVANNKETLPIKRLLLNRLLIRLRK